MAKKEKNKKVKEKDGVNAELEAAPVPTESFDQVPGQAYQGQPPQAGQARARRKPLQLDPIIQPIAFVPYSTQQQELYMWEEEQPYNDYGFYDDSQAAYAGYDTANPALGHSSYDANAYNQGYGGYQDYGYANYAAPATTVYDAEVAQVGKKKGKKVSFAAIILIVLSLLSIALIVIGKFVSQSFLFMTSETSGLDLILNFFKDISGGFTDAMIIPIMILVVAVGCLLMLIGSLIGLFKKGATLLAKIGAFLGLASMLVALIIGLMKTDAVSAEIGLYILTGIMFLCVIIAFGTKNSPKVAK